MRTILADANIEGYIDFLVALMQAEPWKLFWDHLELRYVHFGDVGLPPSSPDSLVWQICQQQGLFLITDNRNQHGPDSLEATHPQAEYDPFLAGLHDWRCSAFAAKQRIRQRNY